MLAKCDAMIRNRCDVGCRKQVERLLRSMAKIEPKGLASSPCNVRTEQELPIWQFEMLVTRLEEAGTILSEHYSKFLERNSHPLYGWLEKVPFFYCSRTFVLAIIAKQ